MKELCLSVLFACGVAGAAVSPAAAADVFDTSPTFRACASGMIGGFSSGLDEQACKNHFSLPSSYHFACAQGVVSGFQSNTDRAACVSFFEGQVAAAKAAYVKRTGQ